MTTVALIVLCQSTQAIAFGAIALFLPLIRDDIDLTCSQAGTLAVASTLTYAAMQIPSGYLADRFGPRRRLVRPEPARAPARHRTLTDQSAIKLTYHVRPQPVGKGPR